MNKHFILLALSGLTMFASCQSTPTPTQAQSTTNEEPEALKSADPDDNDLLRTLEGRWQSVSEPGYVLEISDTQANHFRDGKLVLQSTIDADGACNSTICRTDGADTSDGWCFTEIASTGDKKDPQCHFVTHCDTETLQYHALGKPDKVHAFKKIQ